MEKRFLVLLIFAAAYILFVLFPKRRAWTASIGALLMITTGTFTLKEALWAINWNVMGVFVGTLVLADLFIESRVPAYLAEKIVNYSKNSCFAILFICGLTSFVSAFVENVATVMIIAPIGFSLARKLSLNPVKMLIAIAVSSNLQGAATLIGDPPSMLLAGFAKLNFLDFFVYRGKPGIFFAVQVGAVASFVFLYWIFKRERSRTRLIAEERVRSRVPAILLIFLILALALSSFFDPDFVWIAGVLCMATAFAGAVWDWRVNKCAFLYRIKTLDWDTTFFLMGVFILADAIAVSGWMEIVAESISARIGSDILFGFILIVVLAMLISAFVDNVPFLAAMLPMIMLVSNKLSVDPTLFLFGLLLGASIGGNITPIGAASNIVCVGLLKKEGYQVSFMSFMKLGLPFTLISVLAASVFVWVIWGP